MSDTRQFQETIKGVGSVTLTELDTGIPLHLPTAKVAIDLGLERRVQEGKNPLGEIVTMGGTITARRSRVTVTFSHYRPEVIQFIFGFRFEKASVVRRFSRQFTIPLTGIIPPVAAGVLGSGMAADQPDSRASIVENGLTKGLIRVPYAADGALTAYQFMQGPNRVLRFDPALAAKQKTVTFASSATFPDALDMGEEPLPNYALDILMTTTENFQLAVEADNSAVEESGQFDPDATDIAVPFRIDQSLGGCASLKVTYLGMKAAC